MCYFNQYFSNFVKSYSVCFVTLPTSTTQLYFMLLLISQRCRNRSYCQNNLYLKLPNKPPSPNKSVSEGKKNSHVCFLYSLVIEQFITCCCCLCLFPQENMSWWWVSSRPSLQSRWCVQWRWQTSPSSPLCTGGCGSWRWRSCSRCWRRDEVLCVRSV